MSALTPEEWLTFILERVPLLEVESVPISNAVGRTLAVDVYPAHALPVWENSAMDGYAVHHSDLEPLERGEPVELTVVGEVPAGSDRNPRLAHGESVRIMTGAPIPDDADTVVPVERTTSDHPSDVWANRRVAIRDLVPFGANIRRRGEDVPQNQLLAAPGQQLTPARASALAAAGISEVQVRRSPRVAVVVTGSELLPPGSSLRRGQVPESNSVLISGLLRDADISDAVVLRSSDDASQFAALLENVARDVDVIISTGGVGPGAHDVVRIALEREPDVRAVRVAVRPGQPQCAGRLRAGPMIFALPGNPVSAAVSFELFVRPALLHMQGRADPTRLRAVATVDTGWVSKLGSLQVLPVSISSSSRGLRCRPSVNPRGVSHAVGSHGGTDGYALIEADVGEVLEGQTVPVLLLRS